MIKKESGDALRHRAEQLLNSLGQLTPSDGEYTPVSAMTEELRIYQTELDLQNQELQATNQQLEHLQRHYAALFKQLPIPVMVVEPDGSILEYNEAAGQAFETLSTQVQRPSLFRLLADRSDTSLSDLLKRAVMTGQDGQVEVQLRVKADEAQPFMAFAHDMPQPGTEGRQLLLLLVDRAAEQREREWMQRFQKIAEHVPGVLYQFQISASGEASFPFSTEGIQHIYGVSPEEARQDAGAVIARLHPEDQPRVLETIEASRVDLSIWRCRYRVTLPDGRLQWLEGESQPERLADGGTLWHGYIRDVTRSVLLEEQLKEERNRLANVIWGTGVGTWEWNVQTGEVRFNEQWAAILGYTLSDLAPVTIGTWMSLCHPDDLQRSEEQLQRHFNGESDYYECEARMQHRNGRWLWILDRGRLISRSPDGLPEWMAGTHLDITARKQMEVQLNQLANHDSLTGLPRRELLTDRLKQAMAQCPRRYTRLAVAFIDLDGFKNINDRHGHEAGDRVLVVLAQRMTSMLRSGDTVARLGGDEFVMLMVDLQPEDDGLRHLQRVMESLAEPVIFEGQSLTVTSSVGVAYYPDEQAQTTEDLLRRSDQAMYRAKAQGKNRVCMA